MGLFQKSSYTMSRFLQDREKWSEMIQMKYNSLVASGSTTNACTTSGDIKRRRRTPPSSPVDDGQFEAFFIIYILLVILVKMVYGKMSARSQLVS